MSAVAPGLTPARALGRIAVVLLVVAIVLLATGAITAAVATVGQLIVLRTPPGVVVGGVLMALGAVAALAGAVVGALGVRQRDTWCIVGTVLNGALLAVLLLVVVLGLVLSAFQKSASKALLARYQDEKLQRLQQEAVQSRDAYVQGLLRERVVLIPTGRPPDVAVQRLADGWRLVHLYLPSAVTTDPQPERLVTSQLRTTAAAVAGWLGHQGRSVDAAAILAALAREDGMLSVEVDGERLRLEDLRDRAQRGPLEAAVLQALMDEDREAVDALEAPAAQR